MNNLSTCQDGRYWDFNKCNVIRPEEVHGVPSCMAFALSC